MATFRESELNMEMDGSSVFTSTRISATGDLAYSPIVNQPGPGIKLELEDVQNADVKPSVADLSVLVKVQREDALMPSDGIEDIKPTTSILGQMDQESYEMHYAACGAGATDEPGGANQVIKREVECESDSDPEEAKSMKYAVNNE